MTRYASIYGIVSSVTPLRTSHDNASCSLMLSMMSQSLGQVNLIVTSQTYVLEQHTFIAGDSIIAIYDTMAPVPLIYPPQFRAIALVRDTDGRQAMLDYFDENLVNSDNTLKLSLTNNYDTQILLSNGQIFFYPPSNHYLLVLYMFTTRSIPAITTPSKVIVFCSPEQTP